MLSAQPGSLFNLLQVPVCACKVFMTLKRLILFSLVTVTCGTVYSQKNSFDTDTARISLLLRQADEYRYLNCDTAVLFAMEALNKSIKNKYDAGVAHAKNKLTGLYADLARYEEGITAGQEALQLYQQLEIVANKKSLHQIQFSKANVISELGHNYISMGNFSEGLKYSQQALLLREELDDKKGMSDNFYNIGNIQYGLKNYDEALKNYSASLSISEEINSVIDIAYCNCTIGLIYYEKGDYTTAMTRYNTAAAIAEKNQEARLLIEINNNKGLLYSKMDKLDAALQCFNNAVSLGFKAGSLEQLPQHYNSIASIYMRLKKYDNAEQQLRLALHYAGKSGSIDYLGLTYENLSLLDSATCNYAGALKNYKLSIKYRDSLVNAENSKKLLQQSLQFNFDRREDALLQENILTETKLGEQKKQKYFLLAGAALLALLLLLVYRNSVTQKKLNHLLSKAYIKEKEEMKLKSEHTMLNERLRISSELHDEVGATLSGISMYSHLINEQLKSNNTGGIKKSIQVMQQSSSQMVDKLNDIVWFINPEKDSLQQLMSRLEDYAVKMAAVKGIKVNIQIPGGIGDNILPAETRRNIYLFCKEAINNAIKYSNATTLDFSVLENNRLLQIVVADNGVGFNVSQLSNGNGLDNMRKRAAAIDGEMQIESANGAGTRIQLSLNITP